MWTSRVKRKFGGSTLRYAISSGSSPMSYAQVLRSWETSAEFRSFFISLLQDAPYSAFRWETPPVTTATLQQPFEFVLLDSPGLSRDPEPAVFAEHFDAQQPGAVVEFPNLGKDGIMIAPCPDDVPADFGHLAAFLRNASETQQHALWQLVSAAMQRRIAAKPVWLSTAGGGVAWLHVRLDDRPKYYGYTPYRDAV